MTNAFVEKVEKMAKSLEADGEAFVSHIEKFVSVLESPQAKADFEEVKKIVLEVIKLMSTNQSKFADLLDLLEI